MTLHTRVTDSVLTPPPINEAHYYMGAGQIRDHMQRRHYLAALPVAIAGCSDIIDETPAPDPDETPTPEPEETPEPDETPEPETEETPEPESEDLTVDRLAFIPNWEYLREFDGAIDPNGEYDFRRPFAVLYEVTVPVIDGSYEASATLDVETAEGESLAAVERTLEGDADSEFETVVDDPAFPDRADDQTTVTARLQLDHGESTTAQERQLQLRYVEASTNRARVKQDMDSARKDIADAVDLFMERAGGALTDATAESDDLNLSGVIDTVLPVAGKARDARDFGVDDYDDLIDRVENEHEFIKQMVRSQRKAPEVLEQSRRLYRELEIEGNVASELRRYRDAVSDHQDRTVERDDSVEGYYEEITDGRTVYDYEPKIEQLRAETETLTRWRELAAVCQEGLDPLERAREEYDRDQYHRARDLAEEALEKFEEALDGLGEIDRLTQTNQDHVEAIEELEFEAETVRRRARTRLEE